MATFKVTMSDPSSEDLTTCTFDRYGITVEASDVLTAQAVALEKLQEGGFAKLAFVTKVTRITD